MTMTITSNICGPGVQKQHTLHHRCSSETNEKTGHEYMHACHKNKISMKSLYPTKISFFCLWNLLGQKCTVQLQYLFKRIAKYHGDILFKMMHVVTWIPFYFHWTRFFGNFYFVFFLFQNVHLPRQSSRDNRKLSTITLETMSCPYNNLNDVKCKIYFLKHSVRDELQTPLHHNSLKQSDRVNVNSLINNIAILPSDF